MVSLNLASFGFIWLLAFGLGLLVFGFCALVCGFLVCGFWFWFHFALGFWLLAFGLWLHDLQTFTRGFPRMLEQEELKLFATGVRTSLFSIIENLCFLVCIGLWLPAVASLGFWLLAFGFGFTWLLVLAVLAFMQTPPNYRFQRPNHPQYAA